MIIVKALLIGILVISFFLCVAMIVQKHTMKKNEAKLRANGVTPEGSDLCHGIVANQETGELLPDQRPTRAWYARLV